MCLLTHDAVEQDKDRYQRENMCVLTHDAVEQDKDRNQRENMWNMNSAINEDTSMC